MSGEGARRGRRRWLVALALLVAAAAAAAVAVEQRRALVERLLLGQLARRGVVDASLVVTRVGLRELALRELRIGDGDLTLGALELRFSPSGLVAGRLDSARASDLRIRGRIDAQGLSLGALDALRSGGAAAAAPGLPVLPVARLELERTSVELDTPHGSFEAMLELALDPSGRGRFRATTGPLATFDTPVGVAAAPFALEGDVVFAPDRFEVRLEPAAFSLTLATRAGPQPIAGTTPRLALRGGVGVPALELGAAEGELALIGAGVAAEGLAFELRIDPETRLPSGRLSLRRVRDRRASPRFAPFALDATLAPRDAKLGFEGALRADRPGVAARFAGAHDRASGEGQVELRVGPVRFTEQGPSPADLLPGLAALVRKASGDVEAHAELAWGAQGVSGSADVGLRDLTLETRVARIERANAVLHFDGPWPLRTPRGQLVSMARVDFGLELTNGLLRGALRRGGVIELEQAEWRFAGGRLRTSGRFDPFAPEQELVLGADDVDLAELLALVNLEGLSGTGRLSGRAPLRLTEEGLRISAAELRASQAGGVIRYRPGGGATDALGVAGAALDDFLRALRDFHYHELTLRVDGDAQGKVTVAISLAGANPGHRDGQPYAFNLNVEGRLGDLVRKGTAAYRVPAEIEKRLEAVSRSRREPVDSAPRTR